MPGSLVLQSPAKLNLMLNITGRRADGYHLLETVFQFIDLCDRIEFETTAENAIRRNPGRTPVAETDDIMISAARLLQARYRVDSGIAITIDKRIPLGGGLGGGSSNAATCLLALNRLWQLNLSLDELAAVGLELGADVPVFVHGKAAWATGIGECLQAIELAEPYYLVIHPGVAVSSAQIFNDGELTRTNDPLTIRAFRQGSGSNLCEPVVRRHHPQVGEALDWLQQHAAAMMTGTGACVFAAFDSLEQAEVVKSRVPDRWDAYVARGMNVNPLHRQLELSV